MKPKTKSIIQFIVLLAFGILLVWLALKQVISEKDKIINAFASANYFWVLVSTLVAFLSHFLRAYRWKYLLEPLGHKISLLNANGGVFLGYFANYGIPRMGEIYRCTIADRYGKIPFQLGFGTVITERIIDTLLLLVIFFLTLIFQFSELSGLSNKHILDPLGKKIGAYSDRPVFLIIALALLIGSAITFYVFRKKIGSLLKGKFGNFIKGFIDGLSSVKKMKNFWTFTLLSVLIWTCYFYALYFCLKALPETEVVGHKECLTLMLFGTFGVIFTPGGLGAYHIIIKEVLVFYGITLIPAFALPWLVWTSQFVLVLVLSIIFLIVLPIVNKKNNGV